MFGLNASQITASLSEGFAQQWVTTIYGKQTQYRVLLELDPQYQERAESLKKVSFKSSVGSLVPFESVMKFREDVGPLSVNHYGQLPAVNISFGLRPGVSLGSAIDRINQVARQVLPPTVTTSFQGSAKVFQASLSNLSLLFFLAIGVVYIVLACSTRGSSTRSRFSRASRRRRSAPHAVAVWQRAQHLFVRWRDLADRPRHEERDHADRLRA